MIRKCSFTLFFLLSLIKFTLNFEESPNTFLEHDRREMNYIPFSAPDDKPSIIVRTIIKYYEDSMSFIDKKRSLLKKCEEYSASAQSLELEYYTWLKDTYFRLYPILDQIRLSNTSKQADEQWMDMIINGMKAESEKFEKKRRQLEGKSREIAKFQAMIENVEISLRQKGLDYEINRDTLGETFGIKLYSSHVENTFPFPPKQFDLSLLTRLKELFQQLEHCAVELASSIKIQYFNIYNYSKKSKYEKWVAQNHNAFVAADRKVERYVQKHQSKLKYFDSTLNYIVESNDDILNKIEAELMRVNDKVLQSNLKNIEDLTELEKIIFETDEEIKYEL